MKGLNAGIQRFSPNTVAELTTASVRIPASGVRYPCPMLSGSRFWLVSVLDHFLSGLAPGRFAKIHKFCTDRNQAFAGINGGPPLPCQELWAALLLRDVNRHIRQIICLPKADQWWALVYLHFQHAHVFQVGCRVWLEIWCSGSLMGYANSNGATWVRYRWSLVRVGPPTDRSLV